MRVAYHNSPCRFDTSHPRHLQVHKHHVGEQLASEAHCLLARGGFHHQLHVFRPLQQARDTLAEQPVVVCQQHPDRFVRCFLNLDHRFASSTGMRSAISVPPGYP